MRFGKIDYLNLLPFEVFIRSYPTPSHFKLFYQKKKSYPAKLNTEFLFGRLDAGFVSSITALYNKKNKRFLASSIGIVAKSKVLSVICLNTEEGNDYQSATSNALLKVLRLKGRVLIGDRALVEALKRKKEQQDFIDMAQCWSDREHLPFVFGRLCVRGHYGFFIKMIQSFQKKSIRIPHYWLMKYSYKTGVSKKDILEYLKLISYKIDKKAYYGVERFYRELRILGIKSPKRF